MNRGLFITFEGPECAGKTTQIQLLNQYLVEQSHSCVITREPGGTDIGENLRQILKHHQGEHPIADEAEILLFAAGRAQHVAEIILPAIADGAIVLCDRYVDSTTAYQGHARGLNLDFVLELNRFATRNCLPDLTILMDIEPEESVSRSLRREENLFIEDRIESEALEFHQRVRDGFLKIAAAEPGRIKIIDASLPKETVHAVIKKHVEYAIKQL